MRDRPLDCLIVSPNSRLSAYGPLHEFAAVEPPLWAGLIAAFLRERGYGVAMLDAEALALPAGQIGQAVVDAKPRLVAVVVYGHQPSASTQTMPAARIALQAIRDAAPEVPTILVGGHPSALPLQTLKEEPTTFVAEGEGGFTLAGLIEKFQGRDISLRNIPGLWFDSAGVPGCAEADGLVRIRNNGRRVPGLLQLQWESASHHDRTAG